MPGITLDRLAKDADLEDAGTVVHINGPDGKPEFYGPNKDQPVTITIAGALSKRFRRAEKAFNDAGAKGLGRKGTLGRLLNWRTIDVTAGCVMAWTGFFYDAEETRPLEPTQEHCAAVLEAAPYILADLQEAMGTHADFTVTASACS